MRKDLTVDVRRKVNTLIITDVHGRDIIDTFVRDSIMDAREFAWESQLRFYWDKGMVSQQTARCWPGSAAVYIVGSAAACLFSSTGNARVTHAMKAPACT